MKLRRILSLLLAFVLLLCLSSVAFAAIWTENPTGYTKASDVQYVKVGNYIANWGVREETATFLSSYAESYYTGNYTYAKLSAKQGNANTGSTPSSALYKALKDMMNAKSTSTTSYAGTRDLYKYTDCMVSNYSYISSFYSGTKLNGEWGSTPTWNREHTWPNSKISGNGENDIMMLRPTAQTENTDRGNKAYGESSGFYDPNAESGGRFNVRGDCARIVLYVYVRWGVTNTMWGSSGVMESLDILLKWMKEDPVDTWELGRNDAVQSITGVRNVFVDYPEFAWLLFAQQVPANYPTPSSNGSSTACDHNYVAVVTAPTCTERGYTTHTCSKCGDSYVDTYTKALGHTPDEPVKENETAPNCTEKGGYDTVVYCKVCQAELSREHTDIDANGHNFENGVCTDCGEKDPDYKPDEPQPVENPFVDVDEENDWFAKAVLWATTQNPPITNGTDATHFSPSNKCTRAEIVQFLWNAAGKPEVASAENPFSDVSEDDWYYKAVMWAVANKITNGTDATHFAPTKKCTRAEVVMFLWNASKNSAELPGDNELPVIPIGDDDKLAFTDVSKDDWYYDAVAWAVANNITSGTDETHFSPTKVCTRAEVVQFLYKAS